MQNPRTEGEEILEKMKRVNEAIGKDIIDAKDRFEDSKRHIEAFNAKLKEMSELVSALAESFHRRK